MKSKKTVILLGVWALTLTSCARDISSDVYSVGHVGEATQTYAGVVKNVREVVVEDDSNAVGTLGGGLAGAALGNALGKGRFIPTAAGVLAGAVAGSAVEKSMRKQKALEYIVELDTGSLMTVVQGQDEVFCVGQPVYVQVSQFGRSRVVPR